MLGTLISIASLLALGAQLPVSRAEDTHQKVPNPFVEPTEGYFSIKSTQKSNSATGGQRQVDVIEYFSLTKGLSYSIHRDHTNTKQVFALIADGTEGKFYIVRNPDSKLKKYQKPSKTMDDLFSVENLTKLAGKPDLDIAKLLPVNGETSSVTSVTIPVRVTAGDTTFTINAEARLDLRLKIDIETLLEARKIADKDDRLKKLRESVRLENGACQVNFK